MIRANSTAKVRQKNVWLSAFLAVALVTMISACVVNDDNGGNGDEPESATGWAWRSGSDTAGQAGVYGTKGTASASNAPGAREYTQAWFDTGGRAWVFGGYGYDAARTGGYLNDLWRYNLTSSEWAWVSGSNTVNAWGIYGTQGVPAAANTPGGREGCLTWTDSAGALWLFGGKGFDMSGGVGLLNDVWKFDAASAQWAWITGSRTASPAGVYGTKGTPSPSNAPGGRLGAICWFDPGGKVWIFGGWGHDSTGMDSCLNDLWKFDPATLEWTWISGDNRIDQSGVYGTKGTPAPANVPGSRDTSVAWIDGNGVLWMFGGGGFDEAGHLGQLNDLWKFDTVAQQWTWVSGSDVINQSGVYGTKGTGSTTNVPGGNCGANAWLDTTGKLWLFGGRGYDAVGSLGKLNDLWRFDPATLEWAWMSGSKTADQQGDFGPKGKRYLTNLPGGREYAAAFRDANGRMWVFGGRGYDDIGVMNYLNDLWEYTR